MRRYLPMLVIAVFCAPSRAETTLTFCHIDSDARPWMGADGRGLALDLMRGAAKRLNLQIHTLAVPWKRCLGLLQAGRVDGVIGASYSADRAEYAAYPRDAAGNPDPGRRMFVERYALYVPISSPLKWNGKVLQGATADTVISHPLGYSIGALLKQLGVQADDRDKEAEQVLRKVADGLSDGAALHISDGDPALAERPVLAQRIKRLDPPLQTKPYFLLFSRRFAEGPRGKLALQLWDAVAAERESAEFRKRCEAVGITP